MFTSSFILRVGGVEIIYKLSRACQIKALAKSSRKKLVRQNIYINVSYLKNKKERGSHFSSDDTGQS